MKRNVLTVGRRLAIGFLLVILTTVVVAGMGPTAGRAEAQAVVVSPVHVRDGAGGTLSSGTTRQRGLVQLTDLTPTLLSSAGAWPDGAGATSAGGASSEGGASSDGGASTKRKATATHRRSSRSTGRAAATR